MRNKLVLITVLCSLLLSFSKLSFSQHSYAQGIALTAASAATPSTKDETTIYFLSGATDGYDNKFDSKKLMNGDPYPNFYSVIPSYKLANNGLPPLAGDKKVKLGLEWNYSNNLTITAADIKGFNANTEIWLIDTLLGTRQSLISNPQYASFLYHNPADQKRFTVCFDFLGIGVPVSTFTVSPNPAVANEPVTITFTGTSPASASYIWNFAATGGVVQSGSGAGPYTVVWDASHVGNFNVTLQVKATCFNSSVNSVPFTLNPPTQATITPAGPTSFCPGGSVVLNANTGSGYEYQWLLDGEDIIDATNASFSATEAGAYTVKITIGANVFTSDPVTVTVFNPPTVYNVTGGGAYCSGSSGVSVNLNGSQSGVIYMLKRNGNNTGTNLTGTGSPVSFGLQTLTGIYTVTGIDVVGCQSEMNGNVEISVNPLPDEFSLTGGGYYCPGSAGLLIGIEGSESGVNYQLLLDGINNGDPLPGTGSALSFGNKSTAGIYTVVATNASTLCSKDMPGSVSITAASLPVAFEVTGGGAFCSGGVGLEVGLSASEEGVNYQLQLNGFDTGSPLTGTGLPISFGNQTEPGDYSVIGINAQSECRNNMTGTVNIIVNASPTQFNVTGGGTACAGVPGFAVNLAGSQINIVYQLKKDSIDIGSPIGGSGEPITFGLQSLAGIYTVQASDQISNCSINMIGSAQLIFNPLPEAELTASGETTVCIPDVVVLNVTEVQGCSYQWYLNSELIPDATGLSYNASASGDYSVIVINEYECAITTNSISVTVNSLPLAEVTPAGPVTTGSPVTLYANQGSGLSYQWYKNGEIISNATDDNYTVTESGDFYVMVMNSFCSAASNTVKVTLSAPLVVNVKAEPPAICEGNISLLTAEASGGSGDYTYLWSTDESSESISVDPLVTDTYTVTVNDGISSEVASVIVTVYAYPVPGLFYEGETTFCQGQSLELSTESVPEYTYQWTKNDEPLDGATDFNFSVSESGSYYVIVSNGECTDVSESVDITVNPLPDISVNPAGPLSIIEGNPLILNAVSSSNIVTYQWIKDNNVITDATDSQLSIPNVTMSDAGLYVVYVVDDNGCTNNSGTSSTTQGVQINVRLPLPLAAAPSAEPDTICVGASSVLKANASGGMENYTYMWTPGSLTDAEVTVFPLETTIYSVMIDDGVNKIVEFVTVYVSPLPVANITYNDLTAFCQGGSVLLTAQSGDGYSYQWQRNGVNIDGEVSQTYNADMAGDYTVVVSQNGCSETSDAVTVIVYPLPVVTVEPNGSQTILEGDVLVLTASSQSSIMSYQWKKDDVDITDATDATLSVNEAGIYTVSVIDENGCSNINDNNNTVTVEVTPVPPLALSVSAEPSAVCPGESAVLSAVASDGRGNYSYNWSNTETTAQITVQPAETTEYSVTATDGFESVVKSVTVEVKSLPLADISYDGSLSFCQGESLVLFNNSNSSGYSYQWYLDNEPIENASEFSYSASASGEYYFMVAADGCSKASAKISIVVNPIPDAVITPAGPTTFCNGGSVMLNANTGDGLTYQWYLNSAVIPGAYDANYTATESGEYHVVVTSLGCSVVSDIIIVTVNQLPEAIITPAGPTTFCDGGSVILNANNGPGFTYQWKLNGSDIFGEVTDYYSAKGSGSFSVEVISNGCITLSSPVIVSVNPLPVVNITPVGPVSFIQGQSALLTANASANVTYQWQKDGVNISGATNQTFLATEQGAYSVIIFNTDNCSAASQNSVIVNVIIPQTCNLNVPLNLRITELKSYRIALAWDKVNSEQDSAFIVRIYPKGTKNFRYRVTGLTSTTMGQLMPGVEYCAQVRTRCTSHPDEVLHKSPYSAPVCFTVPLDQCPLASDLRSSNVTEKSAVLSWSAGTNANRFTVRYIGNQPGFTYHFRKTSSNPFTLQWLDPGTTYTWDVKVFCDNLGITKYFRYTDTFRTSGTYQPKMTAEDALVSNLLVYPNPTDGKFDLILNQPSAKSISISLVDLTGKEMFSQMLNDENGNYSASFDISNFAKGIYLLKVESRAGVDYKKIFLK